MFARNYAVAIQREQLSIGPPVVSKTPPDADPSLNSQWIIPIHVEYDLLNTSAAPVQARMGFPLAACSLGDYIVAKHLDFISGSADACVKEPAMVLRVDGQPVTGRWDFVFLRNGAPLGASPSDAGLGRRLSALINLVRDPAERFYREDPAFLSAAKELCTELGGQMKEADCSAFRRIVVHRTFLWEYTFATQRQVHVVHDYRVRASQNVRPAEVFRFDAFCLGDPSSRAAWTKYEADLKRQVEAIQKGARVPIPIPYPREFFTEYVLRTGSLWAGPIKAFELIVRKSTPEQLVSTCFGGLAKTSAVEFRATRLDFSPSEDLRVLYLQPAGARDIRGR